MSMFGDLAIKGETERILQFIENLEKEGFQDIEILIRLKLRLKKDLETEYF